MKIFKNKIAQNLLILSSGTIIAQSIAASSNIVLSKLYSPIDFAAYSIFYSILTILLVLVNLKYDIVILQSNSKAEEKYLIGLNFIVVLIISSIVCVLSCLFSDHLFRFLKVNKIDYFTAFIFVSLLFGGWSQCLIYLFNHRKEYKEISKFSIIRSISSSAFSILSGSIYFLKSSGLILGQLVGVLLSVVYLVERTSKNRVEYPKFSLAGAKEVARKYIEYPKFFIFGSLLDAISIQLPLFFISRNYSQEVLGYYSFSNRILLIPFSFIIGALSQILVQNFAEIKKDGADLYPVVISRLKKISLIVLSIAITIAITGPTAFGLIFGEKWKASADMIWFLVLPISFRFIVSPLSTVLTLKGNTKYSTLWQALYFVTTISVLVIFSNFSFNCLLTAVIINDFALYLIYLFLILYVVKKSN